MHIIIVMALGWLFVLVSPIIFSFSFFFLFGFSLGGLCGFGLAGLSLFLGIWVVVCTKRFLRVGTRQQIDARSSLRDSFSVVMTGEVIENPNTVSC